MQLTKSKLKQIIKEEMRKILNEAPTPEKTAACEKCLRKIVAEVDYDFLGGGTHQERMIHWMCRGLPQGRAECGRWCKCPVLKDFGLCRGTHPSGEKHTRPCKKIPK